MSNSLTENEFLAVMRTVVTALSLLEKLEKRTRDADTRTTAQQVETYLRDAYLDMSGVQRLVAQQSELLQRMSAQHQSARDAYLRGWHDRLTDIATRLSSEEYAQLRDALDKLA